MAGHDPIEGMRVELSEGSTVKDLITHLSIARKKVGIISVDGGLVKDSKVIQTGNFVRLYRPIFGG